MILYEFPVSNQGNQGSSALLLYTSLLHSLQIRYSSQVLLMNQAAETSSKELC